MNQKTLAISEKLGWQEGIANSFGNLGRICEDRGQVKEAWQLWTKARDIYAKIGMPHRVKEVQGWLDGLAEKE